MMSVQEARTLIEQNATPIASELVPLASATQRTLAEDVFATEDIPAFSRSAMDGYLVLADHPQGTPLNLVGEILAGDSPRIPLPGDSLRVSTGSAVPDSGVCVIKQEDVCVDGSSISLRVPATLALNIRPRGSQATTGELLLSRGTMLTAGHLALLASIGHVTPSVAKLIPVAHIATGREVVSAETVPAFGEIRDSNSPLLAALLPAYGAQLVRQIKIPDDPSHLLSAVESTPSARVILISGGSSVGDHDHTRKALLSAGFEILFAGVALRPGKPLIVARRGETLAFGLPGNPLSHFVCFHLFVRTALEKISSANPTALTSVTPTFDWLSLRNPRETWWPCRYQPPALELIAWSDSSDIRHLGSANALLKIPRLGDIAPPNRLDLLLL